MRPASAAPAAGSADIPAVPRTPASLPPSVGRSRTAARPHAGSVPPHTPPVELARIVPRLSSPAPCLSRQKAIYCRIFTPVQPAYPAASSEGFSLRRLHKIRYRCVAPIPVPHSPLQAPPVGGRLSDRLRRLTESLAGRRAQGSA